MLSRRDFLKRSTLISLAPTVPGFLAQTARAAAPQRDGRVLVVIQLDGGNDGINTVVPINYEGYAKYRKTLRLARPARRRARHEEQRRRGNRPPRRRPRPRPAGVATCLTVRNAKPQAAAHRRPSHVHPP